MTVVRVSVQAATDLPSGLFETFQRLLDQCTELGTSLDFSENLGDDLGNGAVDIAFISSIEYARLASDPRCPYRLLPIAPVFETRENILIQSEVVIAEARRKEFKKFEMLRGHKMALTNTECFSGQKGLLANLKKMGHNGHFFGNYIRTASQREVIEMVLSGRAEVGAVDSNVLDLWIMENPTMAEELVVLKSWGPYAPDAIVVSGRVSDVVVSKISYALLNVSSEHPDLAKSFQEFNVSGFQMYDLELNLLTSKCLEDAEGQELYPPYY